MKHSIFFIFLLTSFNSFSQKSLEIEGKWKVVALSSDHLTIDFKNDSLIINNKLKEKYTDSEELKASISDYVTSFKKMYFEFSRNDSFLFKQQNEIVDKGTYQIDKFKNVITLTSINSNGIESKEQMKYSTINSALIIIMSSENEFLNLTLERLQH